jgi:hypothetical protein
LGKIIEASSEDKRSRSMTMRIPGWSSLRRMKRSCHFTPRGSWRPSQRKQSAHRRLKKMTPVWLCLVHILESPPLCMLVEKVKQAKFPVADDKSGSAGQEPFSKKLKEVWAEKAPKRNLQARKLQERKEGCWRESWRMIICNMSM